MKIITSAILCLLLFILSASFIYAHQQIPEESLNRLQDVFSIMRDRLWEINDERFWHYGEYDRCIAMLRLIAEIDPGDVEAYDTGAWLMQNKFHDEEAEAFLLKGLKNNPDSWNLYFALGWFYYNRLRFIDAINYLESASQRNCPLYVLRLLAHAYEHSGRISDSLGLWLQIEVADPNDAVAKMQVERILSGEPPSPVPQYMVRMREERRRSESRN